MRPTHLSLLFIFQRPKFVPDCFGARNLLLSFRIVKLFLQLFFRTVFFQRASRSPFSVRESHLASLRHRCQVFCLTFFRWLLFFQRAFPFRFAASGRRISQHLVPVVKYFISEVRFFSESVPFCLSAFGSRISQHLVLEVKYFFLRAIFFSESNLFRFAASGRRISQHFCGDVKSFFSGSRVFVGKPFVVRKSAIIPEGPCLAMVATPQKMPSIQVVFGRG
jgi:hypothetical protein